MTSFELLQRIVRRTGLAAPDVATVIEAVPRELKAIPATVALLHHLADAGHELFYLSNMPEPHAQNLEQHNPFFARFSAGVFSCRVQFNIPEPQIFEIAAQRFGAAPQKLVFLDDHAPERGRRASAGLERAAVSRCCAGRTCIEGGRLGGLSGLISTFNAASGRVAGACVPLAPLTRSPETSPRWLVGTHFEAYADGVPTRRRPTMYSLIRDTGVKAALRNEAVPLLLSFGVAETFYKFHSFALETGAFLLTWAAVSYLASRFLSRPTPTKRD